MTNVSALFRRLGSAIPFPLVLPKCPLRSVLQGWNFLITVSSALLEALVARQLCALQERHKEDPPLHSVVALVPQRAQQEQGQKDACNKGTDQQGTSGGQGPFTTVELGSRACWHKWGHHDDVQPTLSRPASRRQSHSIPVEAARKACANTTR